MNNNKITATIDPQKFDPLQIRLLEEIARDIYGSLKDAGVEEGLVDELTEKLTFGISAIIDGSRVMELGGAPVFPVLTFAAEENNTELIAPEGASWMHEYAMGMVEQIIEEGRAKNTRNWMLRLEFNNPEELEIGAYIIGVDMSKSPEEILDELAQDHKNFKKAKLPMSKLAKAYLVQPDGTRLEYDPAALIKQGFAAKSIYEAFLKAEESTT